MSAMGVEVYDSVSLYDSLPSLNCLIATSGASNVSMQAMRAASLMGAGWLVGHVSVRRKSAPLSRVIVLGVRFNGSFETDRADQDVALETSKEIGSNGCIGIQVNPEVWPTLKEMLIDAGNGEMFSQVSQFKSSHPSSDEVA